MFEDKAKRGVRNWQCFVCGRRYDEYDAYKEHITTEHDEGREYITCPACQAPVRDLKSHFKVKHPSRAMPEGMQHRVGVWFDFSNGKRKARGPTFRKGEFESKKNGKMIAYRSGMECEFYECLEQDKDVLAFEAEPFKIPYYWKNDWHNYIPDIKIKFIDGSVEIWEIKPANQTELEQNGAKWAAMNNYAESAGWQFVVQTEVGLGKLRSKIRRQMGLNEG